ncbi:DNA polymerase IV [[Mycoplasma] falconis]|uniref:DNA polymerase IV n=1 Tax=[Mycoplasma] falconis TaxID=92403 RepID=A0A501X949_9BACT|nr:DNA polymerase IV [[Mycoplasma] falconis]TPE57071.1 DNA polymerase IV [[Mycoplasma] falconis]
MDKVIFHIDMDSFFVSCERKNNPSLKNKPVVIATNFKRSIITAASYEVKNKGFKVGEPLYLVKDKIPDLVFIGPHMELYSLISHQVFDYIKKTYCQKIQVYSIDECYLDVSEEIYKYGSALNMAKTIQQDILNTFDLPCSIGVSYSKFLAKMSTNKAKPFGILQTKKEDIEKNFYNLPVDKIFGVGRSTAPKLHKANIHTYKDLINIDNELFLRKIFTKNYKVFINQLKGNNIEENQHQINTKSISNSMTFMDKDSNDINFIIDKLADISLNISLRAKDLNVAGNNISFLIRNTNKQWFSFQKKLNHYTDNVEVIYKNVLALFKSNFEGQMVRGLGIRLSNLISKFDVPKQIDLLESDFENKSNKRILIDELNIKFGDNVLKTGAELLKEHNVGTNNIKFLRQTHITKPKKIKLGD